MKKVYARELNVEVRKAFKTAGVPQEVTEGQRYRNTRRVRG